MIISKVKIELNAVFLLFERVSQSVIVREVFVRRLGKQKTITV